MTKICEIDSRGKHWILNEYTNVEGETIYWGRCDALNYDIFFTCKMNEQRFRNFVKKPYMGINGEDWSDVNWSRYSEDYKSYNNPVFGEGLSIGLNIIED